MMCFKAYFRKLNWRNVMLWTGVVLCLDAGFTLMVIHDTGGFAQSAWFCTVGPGMWIMEVIAGIRYQMATLAILEIAPDGLECSTAELYAALSHSAVSIGTVVTNEFIPVFRINDISYRTYHAPDAP